MMDLRFVVRDGERVLQMSTTFHVEHGEVVPDWRDVPLFSEPIEAPP